MNQHSSNTLLVEKNEKKAHLCFGGLFMILTLTVVISSIIGTFLENWRFGDSVSYLRMLNKPLPKLKFKNNNIVSLESMSRLGSAEASSCWGPLAFLK